ncbi:pimeloyl-ACP methyl ester carboxylesterase [Dyadobacter jejuensis]|uniref:Pimeloyl-ACP methyl ester carboxylesterase n=1 Tax=Dyadobacter jejuensis TaxID=1082580 RepID=A0A316AG26_9BACT|nr:alpha/beta hydrolase [Dyadobacter jejuensis]PWJ56736.1 pimeloyl-ACP methyl ester carboxylesterase [Dyadobacter jejuensis]
MTRIRSLAFCILFASFSLTSCFKAHIITDKDVQKHYAAKVNKPKNYIIKNDTLSLGLSTMGADSLPMLLLIHGAPGSRWGYMNMLDDEELSKRFHIVSVDRLGYGHSRMKKIGPVTSIETHARALLPILALNHSKSKITILGRSYGAPIAATLVSMFPDQFKELIMVSPVIDPEKEKFYWFSKWGRMSFIQWFLPGAFNAATAEKFSHAEELKKILPVWGQLNLPTTVIQGGNDWISDPANIDFAKKHIKSRQAQFIYLNNAGHMITYTHLKMIKEMLLKKALFNDHVQMDAGKQLSIVHSK